MRLLFVHADHFAFEADDPADETAETDDSGGTSETDDGGRSGRREECVVVFVAVEAADGTAVGRAVAGARAEIEDVTDQLRTTTVVLYPFPHLSEAIADPETAAETLRAMEATLRDDYDVLRAPSGGSRTFDLAAKGHPLSKLSRQVTVHGDRGRERDRSLREWTVVFPDGDVQSAAEAVQRLDPATRTLVDPELDGDRPHDDTEQSDRSRRFPEAARDASIVAAVGDSDTAQPQFTPRGTFVRDTLVEWVREQALTEGAVPVETPGLVAPRATVHSGTRPELLSFFGELGLDREALPVRIYQRAIDAIDPDSDDRRLESSTVPELWTIVADAESGKETFVEQARFASRIAESLGIDPCYRLRVTGEFHDRRGEWIEGLAETLDAPVLVERQSGDGGSSPVELAFVTVGESGRQIETATIRLDDGSAARFDLGVEGDGTPSLVRCAPIGSVGRAIAALVICAAERDPPGPPIWLAPTQVRLVPIDPGEHRDDCDELADELETAGVRVDVDDREVTVGERLDRADADWVPYFAAVGRREVAGGALRVTVRSERTEVELPVGELCDRVRADTGGRPRKRSYLSRYLSDRLSGHLDGTD